MDSTMDSTIDILTTLPHYAAVGPMIGNWVYSSTILTGTSISILCHTYPDSGALAALNYIGAAALFLADMIYSSHDESVFYRVFIMNIFIFGWWFSLPPDFSRDEFYLYRVLIFSLNECACLAKNDA